MTIITWRPNEPVHPVFQATVYILNRLDVILSKTPLEEIRTEILPMVFNCLDSSSLHAQVRTRGGRRGVGLRAGVCGG